MYAIMCQRSAASMFGASSALMKDHGKLMLFETEDEADRYVEKMVLYSMNLRYWVVQYPPPR